MNAEKGKKPYRGGRKFLGGDNHMRGETVPIKATSDYFKGFYL
jgi:hypothetical protein